MRIPTRQILIAIAAAGIVASCAKAESESYEVLEQRSLDAWISTYAPNAVKVNKYGMYYEVLTPAPTGAKEVKSEDWVRVSYLVRDLQGNIIYNRDETLARRIGQFTEYTYYKPDFMNIYLNDSETTMQGIYAAMADMKVGEKRKYYIPSKYGYGSSGTQNDYGYGGQFSLSGNVPVILDEVEIIEVIENAEEWEKELLESFISKPKPDGWGFNKADSLKDRYYMEILRERSNPKDTIPVDSTVYIYYVGRFMDGFVFDTNIDTVWYNTFGQIRQYDDTDPIEMVREETPGAYYTSKMPHYTFTYALPELCYGDSVKVAFSSIYAYYDGVRPGYRAETVNTGNSNSYYEDLYNYYNYYNYYGGYGYGGYGGYSDYSTQLYLMSLYNQAANSTTIRDPWAEIKPYTPLTYTIIVMPKDWTPGEDDDE